MVQTLTRLSSQQEHAVPLITCLCLPMNCIRAQALQLMHNTNHVPNLRRCASTCSIHVCEIGILVYVCLGLCITLVNLVEGIKSCNTI